MMLGIPEVYTSIMQAIAAWSSTFAFFILFKRIYPELTLMGYIKQQFITRINLFVLGIIIVIQVFIVATTIFLLSNTSDSLSILFSHLGIVPVFLTFLDTLVRGPLGEELGWRGFALNELQKQYSPLKSAIIIGILWGGWHTPLWFASGYVGIELLQYIALFMVGIVSFSIIVTVFYNLNRNLLIPIVIHQLFNFLLAMVQGDLLDILVYYMLSYFVIAIILIAVNPKKILYNTKRNL